MGGLSWYLMLIQKPVFVKLGVRFIGKLVSGVIILLVVKLEICKKCYLNMCINEII